MSAWQRLRRDKPWWLLPATVVFVLGGFSVYVFWTAVLAGSVADCAQPQYHCGPFLSPFFSPKFGNFVLPAPLNSPALWVLPFPLLFRATCYYYRKAYYRSFFWDPPACAIGELRHGDYKGESSLPFILNNLHRYFMYLVTIVLVFLWIDAIESFHYNGAWYLGFGSVLMLVNVVLLTGYSVSCHSVRHLVGGRLDCFSRTPGGKLRYRLWHRISELNERHPMYAWLSLFSVLAVDVYIRLLQAGILSDPHWVG